MVLSPSGCKSVGSFCGPIPMSSSSDEHSAASPRQNPPPGRGGVQAFMNGIMGPFMACWQPPITACVSPMSPYGGGCMGPVSSPVSPRQMHQSSARQATTNIQKPHPNDVLCGRGGATNSHIGNLNFRTLVAANKEVYVTLTKKQKMMMARAIVDTVHKQEPPGRFLQKDQESGTWFDIGVPRSLEKTSQALREKTAAEKAAANTVDDRDGSEAGSRTPDPATPTNSAPNSPVSTPRRSSRSPSSVEAPGIIIPDHLEAQYNPQLARRRMIYPECYPAPKSQQQQQQQPYLPNFSRDPRKEQGYDYTCRYAHPGGPPPPPPLLSMYHPPHQYSGPAGHDYRDHRSMRTQIGPPPPPPPPRMQPPMQTYPHKASMSSPIPPSSPMSSSVVTPEYSHVPARTGAPQVSPGRRQEWKRRRASEDAAAIRVPDISVTPLHQDMQERLSFRDQQSRNDLASPSAVLQSRSRRSSTTESSHESPGMSGLAALSSAALLKLGEER